MERDRERERLLDGTSVRVRDRERERERERERDFARFPAATLPTIFFKEAFFIEAHWETVFLVDLAHRLTNSAFVAHG